jgi:hypothetical protein
MRNVSAIRQIRSKYRRLAPMMDERMRRPWAASEAEAYGWGGVSAVSKAIGMSRVTVEKGSTELAARAQNPRAPVSARTRHPAGVARG